MPNRLAAETSLYLRQHADNPVDWYPWGPEALARAKAEGKPICCSIGYAACHWCHVMAEESFADADVARIMNEHFVNIKVDREERPDLDHIYQTACQLMTGSGGWPLTVFLTPQLEPFFIGTYFPKQPRHNLPGFPGLLIGVSAAYRERAPEVAQNVGQVLEALRQVEAGRAPPAEDAAPLARSVLQHAAQHIVAQFDAAQGGFGDAPKFPMPTVLDFLLRYGMRADRMAEESVLRTLQAMACGGMYDQLGGGFHRYSVDAGWLVPHFEKMLYDNALLLPLYADAYLRTGDPFYRNVAVETVGYLCREMRMEAGFASSQDADSEHEEGKYFVWTWAELTARLTPDQRAVVAAVYGVTPEGNFEGKNILYRAAALHDAAAQLRQGPETVAETLKAARQILWIAREQRVAPARNDQVLASWNALAVGALARVGMALQIPEYIATAENIWEQLRGRLWDGGTLHHIWAKGQRKVPGFADDYVYWAATALILFEATGAPTYLEECLRGITETERHFWDGTAHQLYLSPADATDVVVRPRATIDQPLPSPTAVFAETLFRLSAFTGIDAYRDQAEGIWERLGPVAGGAPMAFASVLSGWSLTLTPPLEIVIVGPAVAPATRALADAAAAVYRPDRILFRADPDRLPASWRSWPLLAGRLDVKQPTAFVCHGGVCQEPITEPVVLRHLLKNV